MTKISRFTIDRKEPFTFDPKSEKLIIEWASDGHNGAALGFELWQRVQRLLEASPS